MNHFKVSSIVLILLHSCICAMANVKITPIAVDSKNDHKSDLKVEEARFRDPMPEFYDRNRQGFVTSPYGDNYGGSAYDRYGYNSGNVNTFDRYGSYGTRYGGYENRDKLTGSEFLDSKLQKFKNLFNFPAVFGGGSSLENKFNLGGSGASAYGNSGYGNSGAGYPSKFGNIGGGGGSIGGGPVYGPYGNPSFGGASSGIAPPMGGGYSGLLPPELEAKGSVLLPLAGAALLGKIFNLK